MKSVCVIGAGPSGLCAIRHSIAKGLNVVAYEKSNQIGGQWVFTYETGADKNGIETHSSLYEGLLTNLPKEVMEFPDFRFPQEGHSFVTAETVLSYLNSYADEFKIRDYIKFNTEVIRVRPLHDDKWEVIVRNLQTGESEAKTYDGVMICNGFSQPSIPEFPGIKLYQGRQVHSHAYRTPNDFCGEKVLVVGGGPSGIEIAREIGAKAEKVFWSNHTEKTFRRKLNFGLRENVKEKPDLIRFTENGGEFEDETFEKFSVVLFATGFKFSYPFLSVDCGLSIEESKHVKPLFKHCININHPTMAIIALPFFALGFPLFDLQVRFFLKFFSEEKKFLSKAEMMEDLIQDEKKRESEGLNKKKSHFLGPQKHAAYYEDLAVTAEITQIRPVYTKIFNKSVANMMNTEKCLFLFRNYKFTVINDEDFNEEFIDNPVYH